jgi:hypothetical protein
VAALGGRLQVDSHAGIVQRLWLTERTVETHVASIMAKLDPCAGRPRTIGASSPS